MPLHLTTENRSSQTETSSCKPHSLEDLIAFALDQKKGEDIVTLSLEGKSTMADSLVIATGTSTRHTMALAADVIDVLHRAGTPPLAVEGMHEGQWIVVDAGDVIVHLFQEDTRALYQLEKMWSLPFDDSDDSADDAA